MFGQTRLNELRARKELLLVQADLQRRLLTIEAQNAADALRWTESVYGAWQHIRPWAWLAAPTAGFFLARHGRSIWRWGQRLIKLWRWVSRVW